MIINACAISDIGNVRSKNEDNYYLKKRFVNGAQYRKTVLKNTKSLICSVCDGMGGERRGDIASKIAVETIKENANKLAHEKYTIESINDLYLKVNQNVIVSNNKNDGMMGTTMSLLCVSNHSFIASNVGDTRIYCFSKGTLSQLSCDHTRGQLLAKAGLKVDKTGDDNHVLTQFIGINSNEMIIEPHIVTGTVKNNDVFLLCSDGMYDYVSNKDIAKIVSLNCRVDITAQMLVDEAKKNNSNDNITVAVICVSKFFK